MSRKALKSHYQKNYLPGKYSKLCVCLPPCLPQMITGDHLLIAKETSRMLGLGTNIQDPTGLPTMDADGKAPKDLGKKFGKVIMEADGFAQVCSRMQ